MGYKLYALPFTHKTKPILEGRLHSVPLPVDETVTLIPKRLDAKGPKLAEGPYVLELTVDAFGVGHFLKAIFFTVKGELFAASKEVDFAM